MKTTIKDIKAAQAAGYDVKIIINGEFYELAPEKLENIYKKIDDILLQMKQEGESRHELTTKALNYEYNAGKLYGLYNEAKNQLTPDDFITLYSYRQEERKKIIKESNENTINKLYKAARAAGI